MTEVLQSICIAVGFIIGIVILAMVLAGAGGRPSIPRNYEREYHVAYTQLSGRERIDTMNDVIYKAGWQRMGHLGQPSKGGRQTPRERMLWKAYHD